MLNPAFGAGVHYDQWGNGYSSAYNTYYSDKVIKPSWSIYSQSRSTKSSWKNIFGATALASTIKSSYKPKKSWFSKTIDGIKNVGKNLWQGAKNIGKSIWNGGTSFVKNTWSSLFSGAKTAWQDTKKAVGNTWKTIKQGSSNAWNSLVNTGKAFGNGIVTGTKAIGRTIGKIWNGGINIIKGTGKMMEEMWREGSGILWDGLKSQAINTLTVVAGGLAWYNEWRGGKKEKKEKIEKLKEESVVPAIASEIVYGKDDEEEKIQEEEFSKIGFEKITDDVELGKYGLKMELLENKESGLRARIYINRTTGEVILAFAGTNPLDPADTKADVEQSLGLKTAQYDQAKRIGEKLQQAIANGALKKGSLIITGHSLGGGEASLVGVITGAKTYVFNASGLHPNTLRDAGVNINNDFSNIVNFRTAGDLLTHMQEKADTQEIDYFLRLKGVIKRNSALNNTVKPVFDKYYTSNLSPEAIEIINGHIANHDKLKDVLPDAIGQQVNVGNKGLDLLATSVSKTVGNLPVLKYTDDVITRNFNDHSIDITLETLWGAHQHTSIYHYN